jgi:hypothetical protein
VPSRSEGNNPSRVLTQLDVKSGVSALDLKNNGPGPKGSGSVTVSGNVSPRGKTTVNIYISLNSSTFFVYNVKFITKFDFY